MKRKLRTMTYVYFALSLMITLSLCTALTNPDHDVTEDYKSEVKPDYNPPLDPHVNITDVKTFPNVAIVNHFFFINITVKNNGQFEYATINIEINVSVKIDNSELKLRGTVNDLSPGEIEVAQINLTFIQTGPADVTITIFVDDIESDSKTIQVQVVDDNITTLSFGINLFMTIVLLPLVKASFQKRKILQRFNKSLRPH